MRYKLNIAEYSITTETTYTSDVRKEQKEFPLLVIGRDSYIEEAWVETVLDSNLIYNIHIGRYTSIAGDVKMIVDMNHDYKRVCQGRISGVPYRRPDLTRRKGQIMIMNDCWIGDNVTIMSGVTIGNGAVVAAGTVVVKNVPPFAIVAGNPARVIGYRFGAEQIEALNLIRWWNWSEDKVKNAAELLYGNIDAFIEQYLPEAKNELVQIPVVDVRPIAKQNEGPEKILLYIPDFEQEYPTYMRVIEAFVKSYANTNYELLLYVRDDTHLQDKLDLLDTIFAQYEDVNCYVNLYIGQVDDERSLFGQVDAYITNRSQDNVLHMDMADLYGIPVISSVDIPLFSESNVSGMCVQKNEAATDEKMMSMVAKLADVCRQQNDEVENVQGFISKFEKKISQLSINQWAMNLSVDNLKYEILATDELQLPIIKSGQEAIDQILKKHKSLCRFGDGEFAIIAGENRQKFQRADEKLAERLKGILLSDHKEILIGLPDVYGDLSRYNAECRYNIRAYMTEEVRRQHYQLINMNRIYYDAYLTRPYASYIDNMTDAPRRRFEELKKIWEGRNLLIIEGEKSRLGVGNDLFANAKSIVRILGPAENAFYRYDDLLEVACNQDKNKLVLIAMGATATVLAYDLACMGYQALDIGHVDLEYEWFLAGQGKKTQVRTKYNNEVPGGNLVDDICDPVYEGQIIERILDV